MEDEQLVIPFDVVKYKRNLFEKILHKINVILSSFIRFIFREIICIIGMIFLVPLMFLIKIRKIVYNDNTKLFKIENKIGKNGKIFKKIIFNCKSSDSFLIKTGLRHYPEIINVFLGKMDLVGPKAYDESDKEKMGEYYTYIIQHKPGITGINQISDNKNIKFSDRLDNDFRYHYRKSYLLDFRIILITILVTLRRKSLYSKVANQFGKTRSDFAFLFYEIIKRFFDIIGGFIGILIIIPLTIFVKVGNIICKDYGPVFYSQDRIGKNGKQFKIYKFRSMVENADEKLKILLENDEEAAKEFRKTQKLKNDPRVTKFGKFIRKTSIDEIPQLINVFKGEMSLVGPRPYLWLMTY